MLERFICWFYLIGTMGFLFQYTRPLFVLLTPWSLIMNMGLIYHYGYTLNKQPITRPLLYWFGMIYIISFLVEMVGVNTGLLFGEYTYGHGLGVKIYGTPLLIGANWILLVYATAAIVRKIKPMTWNILTASLLMLGYDFIMEHIAPSMKMWWWEGGTIPLQNYLVWFTLALLFHGLRHLLKISVENRLAILVFVFQAVFFLFQWGIAWTIER